MLEKTVLNVWGGALVGARSDQQDTFLTVPIPSTEGLLAIVADGMGGHASGALASQTAAAAFRDSFLDLQASASSLEETLNGAVVAANDAIQDMQAGHPERTGMGTTLIAVHMTARGLSWISVGDSALLLCRGNQIYRLNEDHSLRGLPEFAGSRQSNMLRSALTGDEIALIDCRAEPLALERDDIVLLASDGLLTLTTPEIAAEVWAQGAETPEALGPNLLQAVEYKAEPKQDNCTVIVITAPDTPPRPDLKHKEETSRKAETSRKTDTLRSPEPPAFVLAPAGAATTAKAAAPAKIAAPAPSQTRTVALLLIAGAVLIAAALLAFYW